MHTNFTVRKIKNLNTNEILHIVKVKSKIIPIIDKEIDAIMFRNTYKHIRTHVYIYFFFKLRKNY